MYNFEVVKKSGIGAGMPFLKDCIRVGDTSITIAGNVFKKEHVWVKFDVDTEHHAIRVREGTPRGKRSYSFRVNSQYVGAGHSDRRSISTGTPRAMVDLITDGELETGIYKLDPQASNVFVLET